jgi:alpha-ketoglutarate-dependent 2,4-dichlorophenoxyacetate dioxygenase
MAVNPQEKPDPSIGGSGFKTFRVKELHPTFGAEIEGVNFSNPGREQFEELLQAMAKV